MANRSLGQHFLRNRKAVERAVAALVPESGETIIEVGPGHGELTLPLADRCALAGSKLIAIEKDAMLAEELKRHLGEKHVQIMTGDVLRVLPDLRLKNYKVAGNIPYYLTGHLLRIIGELAERPTRCVLMVQKEVAERLAAGPPEMNRLAASVQLWAAPKILMNIPREDFEPSPQVDSSLISLETTAPTVTPEGTLRHDAIIRVLFAQPRKTILNNLSAGLKEMSKEEVVGKLGEIGIRPDARPQDLRLVDIQAIMAAFWG